MKKTRDEDDFYAAADDNIWYQGIALEMIGSAGIKSITTKGRFLKLIGENKTWNLDIRKKNLPAWNLIFFNRNKEPEIISTIDLTTKQIVDYFDVAQ